MGIKLIIKKGFQNAMSQFNMWVMNVINFFLKEIHLISYVTHLNQSVLIKTYTRNACLISNIVEIWWLWIFLLSYKDRYLIRIAIRCLTAQKVGCFTTTNYLVQISRYHSWRYLEVTIIWIFIYNIVACRCWVTQ